MNFFQIKCPEKFVDGKSSTNYAINPIRARDYKNEKLAEFYRVIFIADGKRTTS